MQRRLFALSALLLPAIGPAVALAMAGGGGGGGGTGSGASGSSAGAGGGSSKLSPEMRARVPKTATDPRQKRPKYGRE